MGTQVETTLVAVLVGDEMVVTRASAKQPVVDQGPDGPLEASERPELERLLREVAELRMDNEFLGKAAALVASK